MESSSIGGILPFVLVQGVALAVVVKLTVYLGAAYMPSDVSARMIAASALAKIIP